MLNLRTPKLNTALNQVAANVANLVGREIRRSNKNGMILAVDVVDFRDHITNLWFANASSVVEQRATDERVWETFVSILRSKESLCVEVIDTANGHYVQFTTLEELPSISFDFNPETLNFVPSGLVPNAFLSDLRNFVNTMSRRPFNEQGWFEKNYPTASNFGEAVLTLFDTHGVTAKEVFNNDQNDDLVELTKVLVSKLVQHRVYKEDLIQGNVSQSIAPETVSPKVETPNHKLSVATEPTENVVVVKSESEPVGSDFAAKLSAALKEAPVEAEEPTEKEVQAEVDASTENSVEAEIMLQEIFSDLTKYHAAPNQGKSRKQIVRSLSKCSSIVENSEMLITLLEVVELDNSQREEIRTKIHNAVSLAVAVEEEDGLDSLDAISDEFESETFEEESFEEADEEEADEEEGDEDEDDVFEFEGDDEDEDDSDDEEDEDEVEAEAEDEDEAEESESVIAELIAQGKGRLRAQARKLGMPLAKSCSCGIEELARYVAANR